MRARDAAEASAKLMLTGDEILVAPGLDESFVPFLGSIAGYVLEGYSLVPWERILEINPDCVGIASAPKVMTTLPDNLEITINGGEKLVYEGIV